MKKAIVFFIVSLFCSNSFCQLLDRSNQWNMLDLTTLACGPKEKCSSSTMYALTNYNIGNDTIIHNKLYSRIIQSSTGIRGYLREAENHKKVYSLLTNFSDSTEVLLYDFTVKKDSVFTSTFQTTSYNHVNYTNTFFSSKVINIDTVEYAGVKRLRIKFEKLVYRGKIPPENITWIEGIGSPQDLLRYDISNCIFLCFKQNDVVMYTDNNGYDCDYKLPPYVEVDNPVNPVLSIFPNPSTDGSVTIKNTDETLFLKRITLYNIQGIKVNEYFPNSSDFKIKNLKAGIYVLEVDNVFTKLIIQ